MSKAKKDKTANTSATTPAQQAETPTTTEDETPKAKSKSVVPATYRAGYETYTKADGNKSMDNGDKIATVLRNGDLPGLYEVCAVICGLDRDVLPKKYENLNVGMQRMNLGNRIRAAIKKNPALMAKLVN